MSVSNYKLLANNYVNQLYKDLIKPTKDNTLKGLMDKSNYFLEVGKIDKKLKEFGNEYLENNIIPIEETVLYQQVNKEIIDNLLNELNK